MRRYILFLRKILRKVKTIDFFRVSYDSCILFYSHFRSFSIGGGIAIPGVVSLAVQYSETLKRAQEAITKNNQAIGTSTVWWGLYSMQLAPSFQLK